MANKASSVSGQKNWAELHLIVFPVACSPPQVLILAFLRHQVPNISGPIFAKKSEGIDSSGPRRNTGRGDGGMSGGTFVV